MHTAMSQTFKYYTLSGFCLMQAVPQKYVGNTSVPRTLHSSLLTTVTSQQNTTDHQLASHYKMDRQISDRVGFNVPLDT